MKMSIFGFLTVVSILVGCGYSPETLSELEIANGKVISESQYPAVVQLFRKVYVNGRRKGAALCTGTWIAEDLILTAAHCTGDTISDDKGRIHNLEMYVVEVTDHQAKPKTSRLITTVTAAWREKSWEKTKGSNRFDLAILQTAPKRVSERSRRAAAISRLPVKRNSNVTLVGYGYHNITRLAGKGDDRKRVGYNTVDAVRRGFIEISGRSKDKVAGGDGQDANAGQGDSGGPLFHDGFIVGVASSGGTSGLFGKGSSSYVDLHSEASRAFLSNFQARYMNHTD